MYLGEAESEANRVCTVIDDAQKNISGDIAV